MKRLGFGNQCLFALVLGLVLGHFMPIPALKAVIPFGSAFIKLLQLIIVPLTFSTIVASFSKLESIALVKKLGLNTLIWFMLTAAIASVIGVAVGSLFSPGSGLILDPAIIAKYKPREIPNIADTFLNMLPGNLIHDIAMGRIIPVIIFAIFFGIALTSLHDQGRHVRAFFDEFSHVMFKITRVIIRLSPIGIFALVAPVGHDYGIATLLPLAKFILAIYVACALQLIVYALLVTFVAHKNPITFFRQFWPAMITAFTTSSSLGTMPVTLETLVDRVKIKESVAGFVAPLGATMKMDGCGAIYPAVVCILTANLFNIDLSITQYILIIVTCTIATIGTAGVPGTASIMATVVLLSIGLPLEGLALVIGIDKVVDMMRTMTNVTGSGICALIIDKKATITV
ncbi:MAG: dicarboxylate/amino acid:cation symporter [Burkholderiales bacterium]|jgi:Na+/H+-dicarboxylate symporter|nr:dicarboxylate/amino acid:cation symporter [Burkholderiales bacterium]